VTLSRKKKREKIVRWNMGEKTLFWRKEGAGKVREDFPRKGVKRKGLVSATEASPISSLWEKETTQLISRRERRRRKGIKREFIGTE